MPISDVIREAVKASGKSLNEIARETGIPQPTISRFVLGADLRVSNVDKLAEYFGLQLYGKKSTKRGKA